MSEEATLLEIRELEAEYEILGELGRGGMAIVYLARDRQLGRQVAIKVIHAAAGADEATVARQLVEARTVAQLQHPNVVAIYAVKRLSTLGLALVMQYIPGRTLERAMREDGAFAPERAEAVLTDIAAALAYAHARGVIHRDIKPDNVFLNDETGRALLSDFGIALSAEGGRQQATDMIVGTPAYMSPEQIDGAELDGRSDLFSLGLIGYEMLAGVRPWVDESISDVMYRQKFEFLPSLADVRPDTPDRLRAAIERAVDKEREERWPSADAFLSALTDDEWVPEDRGVAAGGTGTGGGTAANRIAAHLASRGTTASAGSPLQTVQYRREGMTTTPRFGVPPLRGRSPQRGRRGLMIGVPLAVAAAAATLVAIRPNLLRQLGIGGGRARADSVAQAQFLALTRVRDSGARAQTEASRRAADSASAAATSSADSTAALRFTAARDSLVREAAKRDSVLKAESRKQPPGTTPSQPRGGARSPRDSAALAFTSTTSPEAPAPIHPPVPPTVVAGGTHTCALGNDGGVSCWGGNDRGQLGNGSSTRRTAPARVGGDATFAQVSVSIAHSCAVSRSGNAFCWGNNDYGQLGDSATDGRLTPTRVVGTHNFRAVATGTTHSCGLTPAGELWCWGRNLYGQLGDGSTQDRAAPVRVQSGAHFVALTVGWNHSCALDTGGQAYCWGQNASGQLGDGTTIVRAVPVQVGGGLLFRAIAAGGSHTCALSTLGQAYCWGRNTAGQLGTGDNVEHQQPARVANSLFFTDLTAGGVHTCALTRAGGAYCWGRNSYGQLGDGTTTDHATPAQVQGGISFAMIHASGAHTCATAAAGTTYCWGNNSDGQLGDGSTTDRSTPVAVGGGH